AMSGRGGSHQVNVGQELAGALRQAAQAHGRTLYVTLLGAFGLMLSQLGKQPDLVVGTPVRGREQPALEPVMGFFVNMLPMRLRVEAGLALDSWLDRLHAQVVESF